MDLAVAPLSRASLTTSFDRNLAVDDAFLPWLPDGLVRGRTVGCTGGVAVSAALALASRAVELGSWVAVVGVSSIGIEALDQYGVTLERVVAVDADPTRPGEWAERVAAACDGFELVVTRLPRSSGADRVVRKVQQRIRSSGSVVLFIGDRADSTGSSDLNFEPVSTQWQGLGAGHGHLRRRKVTLRLAGRRMPRPITDQLWLPGTNGRAETVGTVNLVSNPSSDMALVG